MNLLGGLVYLILCGLRIKFFNEDVSKYIETPEHVVYFTGDTLKQTIEHDRKVVWVIEAYTNWSNECNEVSPVFADLALDYGSEFLRFGKIDVGKHDKFAKENFINNGPMSKQLPTIIVFEGGKPTNRRPVVHNKKLVPFRFSFENIERDFTMKTLLKEAKAKKGKAHLPEFVPVYKGSGVKESKTAEDKKKE